MLIHYLDGNAHYNKENENHMSYGNSSTICHEQVLVHRFIWLDLEEAHRRPLLKESIFFSTHVPYETKGHNKLPNYVIVVQMITGSSKVT